MSFSRDGSGSYVRVAAIEGGSLTLPEKSFVAPTEGDIRTTVPSILFLIEHLNAKNDHHSLRKHRILFDLGLRSDPRQYTSSQQRHLLNREPLFYPPPIEERLRKGGLSSDDIDLVILSHVHWDHTGDPASFTHADFLLGHGSKKLLEFGLPNALSYAHFDSSLLPSSRTYELPPPSINHPFVLPMKEPRELAWAPLVPFPAAIDLYGDGSVYIVDSPGHLTGHINLLCRTGGHRWIYLGGDLCHDVRLLNGVKQIAQWKNEEGRTCCIHLEPEQTQRTMETVREFRGMQDRQVQVILAHDCQWLDANADHLFPKFIE